MKKESMQGNFVIIFLLEFVEIGCGWSFSCPRRSFEVLSSKVIKPPARVDHREMADVVRMTLFCSFHNSGKKRK